MTTPSTPPGAGVLRTGLGASSAFATGLALGLLMAAFSLGVWFYYLSRWLGGPRSDAGGGEGFLQMFQLALTPHALVAVVLALMMPAYVLIGVQLGRARAMARVVQGYGEGMAQRLADFLAARIEALPRTHQTLHRGADVLSMREVMDRIGPVLGRGRIVRSVVRLLLDRLPMAEIMQQWREARAEHGDVAQVNDVALRSLLGRHVHATLEELAEPSYQWLWMLIGAQAIVLALGIWITA